MGYSEKFAYVPDEATIASAIGALAANLDRVRTPEVLKECFSMMDLTTLRTQDTEESVSKLVSKVNGLKEAFPDYPLPASVCVYPNFANVVRDGRDSPDLHVTTVSSCFPSAQSFLPVKCLECHMAVQNGADEVDIVLSLSNFLSGKLDAAAEEILQMRAAIDEEALKVGRKVILKVILETGLLVTPQNIADASFIAMESGADFIKTSTGKVDVNATPTAAFVMCQCIRKFYEQTGRKVGFKAAGGISTADDALCYYLIGENVLGKEWMSKDLFRFGVSRLGNSLISAVEGCGVKYF